ncbi:EAL domain-containing protein [Sodalis sp. C49]|uniref:EAL domain-containing protein n=1 Tax=unclassified Sodalis (in: enterobacteria) TaxID=2636512 RepID=UPI003965AA09
MPISLKSRIIAKIANKYRMLFWVIIPLCFFIFSVSLISFFAYQTLKSRADHEIGSTLAFVDTLLNDADATADEAIMLLNRPCAEIVDRLRMINMRHSLVRTVILDHQGLVYCSPVPAPPNMKPRKYAAEMRDLTPEIELRAGTLLFPGIAVIVLRKHRGNDGVSVVIDTQYMHYMMDAVGSNNRIFLSIKNQSLSPDGRLIPSDKLQTGFIAVNRVSRVFPFALSIAITQRQFFDYMVDTYAVIILFSVVVCLVMSLLIRNWLAATTSIRTNMALALKRNEFEPYFQPVMNVANDRCAGVEILTRWRHPTDGFVSPEVFIPLAEESGLIIPLTRQLMQQVATVIADSAVHWRERLHVAINISANHLADRQIVEDCRTFLQTVQDKNIRLVLELTERQFIDVNDTTLAVLAELQQLGVAIAIDDFGTGYSGLSYLSKMNIDFLKIDQSFVAMIEEETTSRIIVDVVIDLAVKLDMKLIAEGVENARQKAYLLDKQVFFQQGYFFSRPMALTQFSLYMREEHARHAATAIAP